ncbi:CGNR zinc finger domain-containing protein [Flindersiella endophytica]
MNVDASNLPLVAGHRALDLVNTVEPRVAGQPPERDHLGAPSALLVWARRAGLADEAELAEVARAWERDPGAARAALAAVTEIRESLYAALAATMGLTPADAAETGAALERLHTRWHAAVGRSTLRLQPTQTDAASPAAHTTRDGGAGAVAEGFDGQFRAAADSGAAVHVDDAASAAAHASRDGPDAQADGSGDVGTPADPRTALRATGAASPVHAARDDSGAIVEGSDGGVGAPVDPGADLWPTGSAAFARSTPTLVVGMAPALLLPDRAAAAAYELLFSADLGRLGRCPTEDGGCGWLFLDHSRNRSRRWCRMADCGAEVKARRLTERRRAARTPSASSDLSS